MKEKQQFFCLYCKIIFKAIDNLPRCPTCRNTDYVLPCNRYYDAKKKRWCWVRLSPGRRRKSAFKGNIYKNWRLLAGLKHYKT